MTWSEKRRVEISAGELAFVEMGDPGEPTVVLLHGIGTSSFLWRNVAPLFSPWMHVVAPDLLATGDSRAPSDARLGLRAQSDAVRELLDALGVETCAIVGHGLGGGIAQILAFEGRARSMILVDSAALDARPEEPMRRAAVDSDAIATIRAWFDLGMGHRARLSESELDEYLRPYRADEGAAALSRLLMAAETGSALSATGPDLRALEIPVLVLWGEDDPFCSAELAERLADALPRSSAALVPGCSHFLPEDAPETIAPLMFEYLRSMYLGVHHDHGGGGPVPIELGRRPTDVGDRR